MAHPIIRRIFLYPANGFIALDSLGKANPLDAGWNCYIFRLQ